MLGPLLWLVLAVAATVNLGAAEACRQTQWPRIWPRSTHAIARELPSSEELAGAGGRADARSSGGQTEIRQQPVSRFAVPGSAIGFAPLVIDGSQSEVGARDVETRLCLLEGDERVF
jgi:hypothetical protein